MGFFRREFDPLSLAKEFKDRAADRAAVDVCPSGSSCARSARTPARNPSKAAAKEATANGDVYRTAEAIHNAHGGAGPAHYCPWPGCVAFRDFAPPTHVAVVA